jgi:hypothetical protein
MALSNRTFAIEMQSRSKGKNLGTWKERQFCELSAPGLGSRFALLRDIKRSKLTYQHLGALCTLLLLMIVD